MADKLLVVRPVVGQPNEHCDWMIYTNTPIATAPRDMRPHFGSVVAKVQGPTDPLVPAFVDLSPTMPHRPYISAGPASLGRSAAAVKALGEDITIMKPMGIPVDRLSDRKTRLASMD